MAEKETRGVKKGTKRKPYKKIEDPKVSFTTRFRKSTIKKHGGKEKLKTKIHKEFGE